MITTRGGTIAVICSRFRSQYNYEFAMDTMQPSELGWGTHRLANFSQSRVGFEQIIADMPMISALRSSEIVMPRRQRRRF
jgi:hypothetical protein